MSDLAPNMMGIADVDHARSMNLVDLAVDFSMQVLRPGGDLLLKVFQGREFQPLARQVATDIRIREVAQAQSFQGPQRRGVRSGTGLRLV